MANAHDLLMAQRAAMMGGKQPYLRRVAYLESHGTEYIDTGIEETYGLAVAVDFQSDKRIGDAFFAIFGKYGARSDGQDRFQVLFNTANTIQLSAAGYNTSLYYGISSILTSTTGAYVYNNAKAFIELDYHRKTFTYGENGAERTLSIESFYSVASSGRKLILFGRTESNGSIGSLFIGKVYGFKIKLLGIVVADLIPVLDLSGRPCMYNQAPSAVPADDPSRFFYNQGTGEFTPGHDVI